MKKILLTLTLIASLVVQAQTALQINLSNGEKYLFKTSEISSIDFLHHNKGSKDAPFTVTELLDACASLGADAYLAEGAEVYTQGVVSKIKEANSQYGNITYYISDTAMGSKQMYVYRGKLLNGARATSVSDLHIGDTVVVCGKVVNYKGSTLEYETGNYLTIRKAFNPILPPAELQAALSRLEFPQSKENGNSRIIIHKAKLNDVSMETGINYAVEWDTSKKAQRWSCYQLYESVLQSNTSRSGSTYPNDFFLPDNLQFAVDPYKGNGYDHGHICPSADRLSAEECNAQTFFLTNMQPQTHSFNAGIWSRMEDQVRTWAEAFDTLYVCKGGTIDSEDMIISYISNDEETIPVPKYFFMALLGKSGNSYSALGFWVEHASIGTKTPLTDFVVNISQLEQLTSINFFHNLPDNVEQSVETQTVEQVKEQWFRAQTR